MLVPLFFHSDSEIKTSWRSTFGLRLFWVSFLMYGKPLSKFTLPRNQVKKMYSYEAYASYEASSRLDTGVFVDVLTLIWSILVLKIISKIPGDNGFNHRMRCCRVYICCHQGFKDFLNCGGEYSLELVYLWYMFKLYIVYFKGSHLSLEMFQFLQFHYVFTCEVVYL